METNHTFKEEPKTFGRSRSDKKKPKKMSRLMLRNSKMSGIRKSFKCKVRLWISDFAYVLVLVPAIVPKKRSITTAGSDREFPASHKWLPTPKNIEEGSPADVDDFSQQVLLMDFSDQYVKLDMIGSGAHSMIYKVVDKKTAEIYAAKEVATADEELKHQVATPASRSVIP